ELLRGPVVYGSPLLGPGPVLLQLDPQPSRGRGYDFRRHARFGAALPAEVRPPSRSPADNQLVRHSSAPFVSRLVEHDLVGKTASFGSIDSPIGGDLLVVCDGQDSGIAQMALVGLQSSIDT